jgi:ubiquinone/menaquinone biosynthesis C-methylase UbiE
MDQRWTERLFKRFVPHYRHRWEIYNERLNSFISRDTVWIDLGCGRNEFVASFGRKGKLAIGVDVVVHPEKEAAHFVQADFRHLPFPSNFADLISLRMVVEHIGRVPDDFLDINRVLKPGGYVLILTTNSWSPMIALPRLLPNRWKKRLIQWLFNVRDDDIFPTTHKFNNPMKMKNGLLNLNLRHIEMIDQLTFDNVYFFLAFAPWYLFSSTSPLKNLRSNILAVFQKST